MSAKDVVEVAIKISAGQAKAEVAGLSKEVGTLGTQAKTASATANTLDSSLKGVGAGAGRAKEGLEGVASALSLVSPEAANLVRGVGMATSGLKGLASVGGGLIGVLGPVAVAVAAFAAVWAKLSNDLDKVNERLKETAKLSKEAQDAQSQRATSVERLRLESAVKQGTSPKSDLDALMAREQAQGVFEPELRRAGGAVAQSQQELAALLTAEAELLREIESAKQSGRVLSPAEEKQRGGSFREQLATLRGDISAKQAEVQSGENIAEGIKRRANDLGREIFKGMQEGASKGTASGGTTPAATAGGARGVAAVSSGEDLGSIIAGAKADLSGQAAYAEYQAYFGAGSIPPGVVTSTNATAGINVAPFDVPVASGEAEALRAARMRQGLSAAGGLLQGDVSGLLAMAGPVGAGIGGLANIGQLGAGGVRDQLEGFTDAIVAGLEALPEILVEVIPDFVEGLISELLPALVASYPDLAKAIAIDLPVALAKAIVDALASILPGGNANTGFAGKTANTLLDVATFGGTLAADVGVGRGSRAIGGLIDRTGYYLMHSGEQVIPAHGGGSGTASRSQGGGGGSTIIVQGSVFGSLDTFSRDLDQHLGYGGPGRSTILGR